MSVYLILILVACCNCEYVMGLNTTEGNTLPQEKGTCTKDSDCLNHGVCTNSVCKCKGGTTGDQCEINVWCRRNKYNCEKAGGKCFYDEAIESGYCKCDNETLKYDERIDKCMETCTADSECQYKGECTGSRFRFCECKIGLSGSKCEIVDWCEENKKKCEKVGGKCAYEARVYSGYCTCSDSSLRFDSSRGKCRETCSSRYPCLNNGRCERGRFDNFCSCRGGTSGDMCETVDWCEINKATCEEAGGKCLYDQQTSGYCKCDDATLRFDVADGKCKETCNNVEACQNGGHCPKERFCQCKNGTSGPKCEVVDWCKSDNNEERCELANAKCAFNGIDSGYCKCNDETFKYDAEDSKCKDLCENFCMNGGSCTVANEEAKCHCPPQFTGDKCETLIDLCEDFCMNGGTCTVEDDSAKCHCPPEFKGYKCETDLCENYCMNGGSCTVVFDTAVCECPPHFTGKKCETLIDLCENFCVNGLCAVEDGEAKCYCPPEFMGRKCETNRCDFKCQNGGTCEVINGEAKCYCTLGFTGDRCENEIKDVCENFCMNGGTCTVVNEAVKCFCPPGFTGNKCETFTDLCKNFCMNGGSCIVVDGAPKCNCPSGFGGYKCEKNLCENFCVNGGMCAVVDNEAKCYCPPEFKGYKCETHRCDSIRCQNAGLCGVRHGEAVCFCTRGFTGDRCEKVTKSCEDINCQNGGTCVLDSNGPKCLCLTGYTGSLCETEKETSTMNSNWMISMLWLSRIGVSLVGVLLFSHVIFLIYHCAKNRTT